MPAVLNGKKFKLDLLFKAEFFDGEIFSQADDDISKIDKLRSSYYDLLQVAEKHGGVKKFWLEGNGHTYLVDLRDGSFTVDGVSFSVTEELPAPATRELVFFRRHQQDFIGSHDHRMWYFMGWQTNINGKNYQGVINIQQLKV